MITAAALRFVDAPQSPVDGVVSSPPFARAEPSCAALRDPTHAGGAIGVWADGPRRQGLIEEQGYNAAHTPGSVWTATPDPALALAVLVIEWMSPVWRAAPQTPRSAAWWVGRVEDALFDTRSPWPDAPTLLRAAALVAEHYEQEKR